jgi:hypothetical protein
MWVATQDLPRSAAHPFYARLNQILEQHGFDGYVEGRCERFYADDGRPGLPPGRYFRLLLIGYFEGLDAERAIAWRAIRLPCVSLSDWTPDRRRHAARAPRAARRRRGRPFGAHSLTLGAREASRAPRTTRFTARASLDRGELDRARRRERNGFHHGQLGH